MKHGWEHKRLINVCEGSSTINWDTAQSKQYIDLSSVDRESHKVSDTITICKADAPSRAKQIVQSGDVIIGTTRPLLKRVCLIAPEYDEQVCSTGFCVLRPKKMVLPRWVYYCLQTERFYSYIEPLQKGISYPAVSNDDVRNYVIPLPPLPVQEQICSLLDKMNRLIEAKKEQLKELDNLAQAIFYDMFGDPVENEKGWEVKDINDICSLIVRGPFGSALKKEFFVKPDSTTYKVYEQKHAINKSVDIGDYHISKEKFTELKRFEVFPKDIIMSCSGTIGELFQIPDDAPRGIMNQALLKFTLNKLVCPSVFLFLMGVIKNNMVVHGCGLQNIGSVKEIKQIKFGLPPLSLQQSFARKIEAIEKQKELINQSIREAQTLFDSRMDYYFGE